MTCYLFCVELVIILLLVSVVVGLLWCVVLFADLLTILLLSVFVVFGDGVLGR